MNSQLNYLDSLQGSGIRPGLARMRALLRAMGNPHRAIPSILVAGTNGKGSTAATLASILRASGYRTGLYTSPHLVELRERWLVDGVMVTRRSLEAAIDQMRRAARVANITPTYFEALTLLAFLIFRAEKCDVVVLEVGMGGRLDATNVVRPIASLITPVDFDHMEYLGRTLRAIAREKAGIIHRGSIALTSNTEANVLAVLERRARQVETRLHRVLAETAVEPVRKRFRLTTAHGTYSLQTPLAGEHQRANVTLAVRAAEEIRTRFPRIDRLSIERGVATTRWRGRLERFIVGEKEVFVDGAHNPHAVGRAATFAANHLAPPRLLVFGVMKDKNVQEMTERLFPLFDRVIATTPPDPIRALPPREIAKYGANVKVVPNARAAIRSALSSEARSILICGSLYLAGAAIAVLDRLTRESTSPSRRSTRRSRRSMREQ